MIEIHVKKGLLCSHFVCDVCHQPITVVKTSMIALGGLFTREKNAPVKVYHVHKGECRQAIEARIGRNDYGDLEMRDHIASLLINIGWRPKDMKEATTGYGNDYTSNQEGSEE